MILGQTLEEFSVDFQQEVLALAAEEGGEMLAGEAFTSVFLDYLATAGEIDDAIPCFYQNQRGRSQVDGYLCNGDEGRIDLFISLHQNAAPPVRLGRPDVQRGFERLSRFFESAIAGLPGLEDTSPAADMAEEIRRLGKATSHVRLFLLTDGLVTFDRLTDAVIADQRVSYHVWDIERLYRLVTSGQGREQIEIDFVEQFGAPVPCLATPAEGAYQAFLALIPGAVLASIYGEHGPRLLERNVRSFLQTRGTVNRGIRETIRKEPERFLAYNNGITATADGIEFIESGGAKAIRALHGLQIVNGGQTTASISAAVRTDRADVTRLAVQAKIIIVDPEQAEEIIPKISLYANSQNPIAQADFRANDPFHVELEKLSRTVWAPSSVGGQRQTKWFYERARGQYADEKIRRGTPARRRDFAREYPIAQKFTKTDLAKYEHACAQLPYLVSRGAQKNFVEFTLRMTGKEPVPDVRFFQDAVARGILFRATEKIVSRQRFGGYRANIVAYTIAVLMRDAGKSIDLQQIWREQRLSEALEHQIEVLSHEVQAVITQPPGGRNVTEWCKLETCWNAVRDAVRAETTASEVAFAQVGSPANVVADDFDHPAVGAVSAIGADGWFRIEKWARQARQLQTHQRTLAHALAIRLTQNRQPEASQAIQGMAILEELERLGVLDANGAFRRR